MNAPVHTAEGSALATIDTSRAPTGRDLILHADNLNAIMTVSKVMAKSRQAVPKHLRDNEGACFAVTLQAMRWNMDPFALGLKTYTTDADSPIAYEGQAIIAALNNSPLLATRLSFRWEGQWERIVGRFKEVESRKTDKDGKPFLDAKGQPKKYLVPDWDFNKDEEGLCVIVSARLVGESEPRELTLLMKQARTRNSPLWTEDPKQQLAYLAGRRWGRLHAPDVIMGVYTPDEIQEFGNEKFMGPADVVPPPAAPTTYPQADFDKNLPAWTDIITKGRKTADALITMVESKGAPMTDAQKNQLQAIKPAQDATVKTGSTTAAAKPADSQGPVITFASIADSIAKATTAGQLDDADDLIGSIGDPVQRSELTAKSRARRAEITPA